MMKMGRLRVTRLRTSLALGLQRETITNDIMPWATSKIVKVTPNTDWTLAIEFDDGRFGVFDVSPSLEEIAFEALNNLTEFLAVSNGGYFVEWKSGADLSADTIEAGWKVKGNMLNLSKTTGHFA
jgi:hypothetical protein